VLESFRAKGIGGQPMKPWTDAERSEPC